MTAPLCMTPEEMARAQVENGAADMTDIINDYFHRYYPADLSPEMFEYSTMLGGMWEYRGGRAQTIFPEMVCADGFRMSVQGHWGAYSTPRDDFAERYYRVEVGYPSAAEELLMPFVGDADRPTDTVYAYVPIEVAITVIEKHGGLVP